MVVKDKDIILAMKEDPDKGFRLLMARFKEPIYWHIRRLVVSHADAQDAAQETFVRIFRSFCRFDESGSLAAWIYRIATNEALRILSRYPDERLSLDYKDAGVGSMMADTYVDYGDLETVKLQNAILSLPAKQQIAFNLRYYDELDYKVIADITGSTVSAAKANYHIAKDKIIQYMNSHD